MSHFAVLVIGANPDAQLAPYHEYESTGRDDEYVTDVDVTDKIIAEFNAAKKVIRLADGHMFDRYDDQFYKNGNFYLPEGATELEMTADEARQHGIGYESLEHCVKEYYGGFVRDGLCYRRTNVRAKWDWYQIGGRWTGAFLLKPGKRGIVGKPGLMTEEAPAGYADQALKGDIDFAQMRNNAEVKARALWKMTREITGGLSWDSWHDTLARYGRDNIQRTRDEYRGQPAIKLLKSSGRQVHRWDIDDDLALDEDKYVELRRDAACVYFAFVRDSQWTERGSMGWFGMVSDEISQAQWNKMFNRMLDDLPDDVLLTLIDAHI
jgi:hypothetical protein